MLAQEHLFPFDLDRLSGQNFGKTAYRLSRFRFGLSETPRADHDIRNRCWHRGPGQRERPSSSYIDDPSVQVISNATESMCLAALLGGSRLISSYT